MANESGKPSESEDATSPRSQPYTSSGSNRLTPSEIAQLREDKRRSVDAALKLQAKISAKKNGTLLERDDESDDI